MGVLLALASKTATIAAVAPLLYLILRLFYNCFLHPLRGYPGPLLWRISPVPRAWAQCRGTLAFDVARFQRRYGPVLRIGPSELAFVSDEAWKSIYGHRGAGEEENPKDLRFYRLSNHIPHSILSVGRAEHGTLRRSLAYGFSERSLRGQEGIIGGYVDLLVRRLRENCDDGGAALNMREWYNWTTFDIIGNLGFGSDFQCLEKSTYSPWIRVITDSIKQGAWLQAIAYIGLEGVARWIISLAMASFQGHQTLSRHKVEQRIQLGKQGERFDFLDGLIKQGLSVSELASNANSIIIAGSETTATLLSGATYLLTSNPAVLKRLADEVRSTFKSEEEITLLSVQRLPYMLACLNESLRKYPPVAVGLPRKPPSGGTFVAGNIIPEGTSIAVWQWAINHNSEYWADPFRFAPERWTGEDPKFAGDHLDAMQPFSVGPRNCIGRNLAYAEMRLILARIIYSFDMCLADDSANWLEDQRCYILWDKPALNVHLTPVSR